MKTEKKVNVFIDGGSNASYITRKCAPWKIALRHLDQLSEHAAVMETLVDCTLASGSVKFEHARVYTQSWWRTLVVCRLKLGIWISLV